MPIHTHTHILASIHYNCQGITPNKPRYLDLFFIEMTNQNPDPAQLRTKLVQMQQARESPTGQFGFHSYTYQEISLNKRNGIQAG